MKNIVEKSSDYIIKYFIENLPSWAKYHNLDHTIETVEGCLEIGLGSSLSKSELEVLETAAWFHDIGYTVQAEGHEEKSVELATAFLTQINYSSDKMITVNNCIMSTKISKQPQSMLDYVIRDADLITLGKKNYLERNNLLRKEMELRSGIHMTELEWLERSINFLTSHTFFTDYAKLNFNEQFDKNIATLKQILNSVR